VSAQPQRGVLTLAIGVESNSRIGR